MNEEEPRVQSATILCPGCGALIEIADVVAYLLGLHLLEACQSTEELRHAV